jgi:AAA+ ATPase superfamily predicted ATPase
MENIMKKREFRGKKLINREDEIKFIKEWFEKIPDEVLWIYGPKSCGKTTLIEYIVENELFDDYKLFKSDKYWVKYINLRGKLLSSYDIFVNSFIMPEDEKIDEKLGIELNLGMFRINYELYEKIKEKKVDLFDVLINQLKRVKKRPILIIDEIQVLEDIYINGDRELLKEFLNFCVRLTKELHLAHVVILSSNTIFIEQIHNDSKLKKTSRFYKIDYLDKQTTFKWLKEEGFSDSEIELIWEYLRGDIAYIQRLIRDRKEFPTLKDYLENQQKLAFSEIIDFIQRGGFTKQEKEIFKNICKKILHTGFYLLNEEDNDAELKIAEKWGEKEILFFDPLTRKVTGNTRLYEKGMELLLNN